MNILKLVFLLSLFLVSSCASEVSTLAPEVATKAGMMGGGDGPGTPPGETEPPPPETLRAPNNREHVVVYEAGVDPYDLANDLNMSVVDLFGDDLALLRETVMPMMVEGEGGVVASSVNESVVSTHGQDLVFGFYEGWIEKEVREQYINSLLKLPALHEYGRGYGIRVAVLDTGADFAHPSFGGVLVSLPEGSGLISQEVWNGIDDDGDGVVDAGKGHGTVCVSIVHEVAPGAEVLPIRILHDEGIGSLWDLVKGLELSRHNQVDIVNLSLSLSEYSAVVEDRLVHLYEEGVRVACATGNQAGEVKYPASSAYTVGVAATDEQDILAWFSNAGAGALIAAPGVDIVAAYPEEGMVSATGTSMACPVVSGSLAVIAGFEGSNARQATQFLSDTGGSMTPQELVRHGRVSPLDAARSWWQ